MKNIISILCTVAISIATVKAQEISVYASAGLAGKNVKIEQGDTQLKIGGGVGLGYAYQLHANWSILSGVEIGWYGNKITSDNNKYHSYMIDDRGSAFEYRVSTDHYTANSSFTSINIPLMVQYRTTGKVPIYINIGGKLFFPMKETSELSAEKVATSGYYPDKNIVIDNIPQHGFGTINSLESTSKSKLQTSVGLSAGLGAIFNITENSRLYTGVYVDYGLTDIETSSETKDTKKTPIATYSPSGLDKAQLNTLSIGNTKKIMAVGIQVRYAFGSSRK